MLQIRSTHGFHATETRLRMATEQAGGHVLAVTDMAALLDLGAAGAMALTVCFTDLYAPLLAADTRFAAFLPLRVAVCERPAGTFLEAVSPVECCRILQRADLGPLAARLEERLWSVMESAAAAPSLYDGPHAATEEQINMRAAVPQRIDCIGTKIEDLAGTGNEAQGG